MRRPRNDRNSTYLNAILTVNAVMLAALVWTHVSDGPAIAGAAAPQAQTDADSNLGVPNAGLQRLQTLNEIKALRGDITRLEGLLSSGKMKVTIGNVADFGKLVDDARAASEKKAAQAAAGTASVAPSVDPKKSP